MDNSPEFLNALHYAATRAAKTGGGVEVLAIITPQDQTHWLGVAEKMREEARETIEKISNLFELDERGVKTRGRISYSRRRKSHRST